VLSRISGTVAIDAWAKQVSWPRVAVTNTKRFGYAGERHLGSRR
jgi:hypothetical protein